MGDKRGVRRLERASLGVAYLAGEPEPTLLKRFGIPSRDMLRRHIARLAADQWRAHRRSMVMRSYAPNSRAGR